MSNELNLEAALLDLSAERVACSKEFGAAWNRQSPEKQMTILSGWLAARRTAPSSAVAAHVSDEGLPPLPDHTLRFTSVFGKAGDPYYTARQMRQYALDAIAAYSAQQQAGPISKAVSLYCIELEQTVADLRAQLARQSQGNSPDIPDGSASAQPAERAVVPDGWQKFTENSQINYGRLVDVVLTNGVYEYERRANQVDWTQVQDWRYSDPAVPQSGVAQEGENGRKA
jgi:hypothetical protein